MVRTSGASGAGASGLRNPTTVIDVVLTVIALPVLAASLYLGVLALVARRESDRRAVPPGLRFDIVVPAHDEEEGIASTVASLLAVDYPRDCFRVLVVADNCTDATADRAAAAGAQVLVRNDAGLRGKGYALAYAFRQSERDGFADAVVVVDADTQVSRNLLSAFAARFAAGASCVQADYGVQNVRSSWRTRVMTIALAAFHGVRSAARERLGLSCGLRGNGMGFSQALLRAHPPQAYSIVEDLEYGIHLGYAGIRVAYVDEAHVWGQMASGEGASRSQRRRWERGRHALVREHVRRLLIEAGRRRDLRLADLAMDLIVPPLGQLVALTAGGLLLSLAATAMGAVVAPWIWGLSLLCIVAYVMRGVAFSGMGLSGLLDLCWAPVYIVWKLTLRLSDKGRKPEEWVRTTREARL
jgi:cellulose synthase/poly-beta-1,6-N-acetylglucosamine synthase-like glycosyltransferase